MVDKNYTHKLFLQLITCQILFTNPIPLLYYSYSLSHLLHPFKLLLASLG